MNFDVFISYSHHDNATANAACAKLESEGIRCWIAPRDIEPSADWASSIIDAIDTCSIMVLIFSDHANQSKQVQREVQRAFERDKPVVPFRIENVTPKKALAYYMGSVHWLDALTPPVEQHLQKLAGSVRALIAVLGKPQGDTAVDLTPLVDERRPAEEKSGEADAATERRRTEEAAEAKAVAEDARRRADQARREQEDAEARHKSKEERLAREANERRRPEDAAQLAREQERSRGADTEGAKPLPMVRAAHYYVGAYLLVASGFSLLLEAMLLTSAPQYFFLGSCLISLAGVAAGVGTMHARPWARNLGAGVCLIGMALAAILALANAFSSAPRYLGIIFEISACVVVVASGSGAVFYLESWKPDSWLATRMLQNMATFSAFVLVVSVIPFGFFPGLAGTTYNPAHNHIAPWLLASIAVVGLISMYCLISFRRQFAQRWPWRPYATIAAMLLLFVTALLVFLGRI